MNNTELLERINSAIELGTPSVDLLRECWQRISDMDQMLGNIAEAARAERRKAARPDELRGILEEIEGMALTQFPE
jgi:hypothetical protein